ncbi:MAG TPA: type I-U CRISPR-associated protein Csb2 [Bryobacteraceae bacterium]
MMTIELRFPARRFHATGWGRHVNEGVPEWPPSPYRLLRALYDAWKRKHSEIGEPEMEQLLAALAAEAPIFRFDPARAAVSHTRSYLSSNTFDATDKSLIFDAFVSLAKDAKCYVTWPTTQLGLDQRALLEKLLASLNYLGRSESWVEARLTQTDGGAGAVCEPLVSAQGGGDVIPLACAIPKDTYRERQPWLEALAYSTSDLIKERRSVPPALRMVQYLRPPDALATHLPSAPRRHPAGTEAVMLSLDATVLPLVTATLEVAEQVRTRLMGIHKRLMGGDPTKVSPKFSGKDSAGEPLEGHRHAFILPRGDGHRISRILLWCAEGFDANELRAILQLRELYGAASDKPIRLVATWRGPADDPKVRPKETEVVSTTPFVAPRNWRRGRGSPDDFLKQEICRECRNHGLPTPISMEAARPHGVFEWVEYRRNRKKDLVRPGYGFRLRFAEPVPTPFSLGYGCHFGLGQFEPER